MNTFEKLMKRVEPVTESGCWIWMGSLNSKGYGRVSFGGLNRKAHRVFYETFFGMIAADLVIDHICRVRCCVNPHHMELVSNKENVMRGHSFSAMKARQTHCKYGHELIEANVYRPKGRPSRRLCKECIRTHGKRLPIKESA